MDRRGYQLKLEKEVKKLNTPEVSSGVPVSYNMEDIKYKAGNDCISLLNNGSSTLITI